MLSKLSLPSELTIYTVADFHSRCVSQVLAQGDLPWTKSPSLLDASPVEEVDAAGLQLLVSLANALKSHGGRLLLDKPSLALSQACTALGMEALLTESFEPGAST